MKARSEFLPYATFSILLMYWVECRQRIMVSHVVWSRKRRLEIILSNTSTQAELPTASGQV